MKDLGTSSTEQASRPVSVIRDQSEAKDEGAFSFKNIRTASEIEAERLAAKQAKTDEIERLTERVRVLEMVAGVADELVALWENPKIQGLHRSERNIAIDGTRSKMIAAIHALRALDE